MLSFFTKRLTCVWSVLALARIRNTDRIRHSVQAVATLLSNSYLVGFAQGKIYRGSLKHLCVPGMNCYSCPGAVGSCPIGGLQAVIGSRQFFFSAYVAGFICLVGILIGRFVCGWLCPFGWFQELLYQIPGVRKLKTFRGDCTLRKLKYIIALIFVILLPMFAADAAGVSSPAFCKWICPVGALEGALPLVLLQSSLRSAIGWLYTWKLFILLTLALLSLFIYRPFCKYLCPLGAFYGLTNRLSLLRYQVDTEKCNHCGACAKACPMNIHPDIHPNHTECIRCGKCRSACPKGTISIQKECRSLRTDCSFKQPNESTKDCS